MTDSLVIAGRSFRSRLIVGTGKEGDHPAHGEGASESPMYLGLGGYTNLSVSNTFARTVTVDSGASGSYEIGVRFRQRGQQRCAAPQKSPGVRLSITNERRIETGLIANSDVGF